MRKRTWSSCLLGLVVGVLAMQFLVTSALAGPTRNCVYINNSHTPYYSIQAAVDKARSGDTIWICEGTYYEYVIVNQKSLELKGWTDDCRKVVIKPPFNDNGYYDGPGEPATTNENGFVQRAGLFVKSTGFVEIENLTVRDFPVTGITVASVDDVCIENVCVIDNGSGEFANRSDGEGIEINDDVEEFFTDKVKICEVHAYDNYGDGVDINDGGDVVVCDVWLEGNGADGLDVDTACTVVVKDSVFKYNGQRVEADGIDIDDVGFFDNGNGIASVGYNGSGYDSDCGLVELKRVWSEHNSDDGLDVECAGDVEIVDGNYNGNGEDGIDLNGVGDVYLHNLNANYNDEDGFDIDLPFDCQRPGAYDVCIDYAEFSFNGEEGIDIEFVDEVKITSVSVNHNGAEGLCLEYAYLLDVYYAEFSYNYGDGINADCVDYIYLDDVWVKHNYDNGVAVNLDYLDSFDSDGCFTYYICINRCGIEYNRDVGLELENVGAGKIRSSVIRGNGTDFILDGEEIEFEFEFEFNL